MSREARLAVFWVVFVVGMAVSFTNVFAPVHELGHIIYARLHGDPATFADWNHTQAQPNISHSLAGWHFEIAAFCLTGTFLLILNAPWGGFMFGHALIGMVRAFSSTDLNDYVVWICENAQLERSQTQNILVMVRERWLLICIIWVFISIIAVYVWTKKTGR